MTINDKIEEVRDLVWSLFYDDDMENRANAAAELQDWCTSPEGYDEA